MFLSESERRKQGVLIPQCRSWIQDGRIQDGKIQDGHHHQVESEWMSEVFLSNVGKGSVSEVFFVQMVGTNLGKYECVWEESKMAESKMVEFWLPSCKLSLNPSDVQMAETKMAEFKMAAIIKWVWVRMN